MQCRLDQKRLTAQPCCYGSLTQLRVSQRFRASRPSEKHGQPYITATACHAHSNQQQAISRRQTLSAVGLLLGLGGCGGKASAVTTDIVEGTQNWFNIGLQSYGLWAQSLLDGISNDDKTGLTDLDAPRTSRFGHVSIPGLSSFSFIHGTLVGGALILLLSLGDKGEQQQQQQQSMVEQPALRPEVEAALRRLLSSPEVSATFHDPAVHAALEDVRGDLRAINKYRDDPAVMQAFQKLLEIEDILERL